MTKSVALVVFSVLMGVVAITGMTTDLSGRLKHVFSANNASVHLSNSVKAAPAGQGSFTAPGGVYSQSKEDGFHDCDSEGYNPLDD